MPRHASNDDRFWIKITFCILLFSAICVFLCMYITPQFEQIYRDALLGVPLPGITNFIIAARIPLALLDAAWPVTGLILLRRRHRFAREVLYLGLAVCLLQIGVTVIALFMPMVGASLTGMSDAKP